jgi:hypothetical protein
MHVILFFLSIIILCVLIWLNKKNKEQFKDKKFKDNKNKEANFKDNKNKKKNEENEENKKNNDETEEEYTKEEEVQPDTFETLSVNNLLEIYRIIDNKNINKSLCNNDKSTVISNLQQTDINDENFIKTINSVNAYDSLINKLKNIGKIIYKPCDNKNKNKNKNKKQKQKKCDPVCNCITDVDMCKNYTFLKYVYNEELEESAVINNIKSGKYINPEITTWIQNTDSTVDTLKDILPSIFFPVERSDSMW